MKRGVLSLLLLFVLFFLESCDYFGYFEFVIENGTEDTIRISYKEQLVRYEDVLPTYDHGEDYQLSIADKDTVVIIEPHYSLAYKYDAGLVNANFPTKYDTPKAYNISPLWERISFIVIGNDTLLPSDYSEDKWVRKEKKFKCCYTLTFLPDIIP